MQRENPFPGMNPYMEVSHLWRGHHNLLISYINVELNRVLPPEFAIRIEERVYVEGWNKEYIPDGAVVLSRSLSPQRSGTAVVERTEATFDTPLTLQLSTLTIREPYLEIRMGSEDADLIAVIEVLSPTNKAAGPGRDEYLTKQRDVLRSGAHLIEIDLLRTGAFSVSVEESFVRRRVQSFDYIISLHRAGYGLTFDVWPASLRQSLPRIAIPLVEDVPDVPLNLQTVLNRVYDEGGVFRNLRYDKPCDPPLSAADQEWANHILREKNLLPPS